ncbi:phosphoglycerate kinase [Buchnera aphidicola]|uniref:Phosphoglycerate kinase n=1 Tax=Buchnera aphidicola (Cinara strobi) TaxID=1921549 RepID=A0A3B1DLZ9_9GAMM|nr:phosphoglycerate kinase [Buchnera aphidicola]VAX76711.1 Phosphoglycerate kinase [Buchnera aphidicola (Cinara strobi)]
MLYMKDIDLNNKKVFIRLDFNVPIKGNEITSSERIDRSIPTIQLAIKKNAKIILASHLGRPKEGTYNKKYSLFPVYQYLKKKLPKINIIFCKDYFDNPIQIKSKQIIVLENVRFNIGETKNNITLSKKYADLCDIFIMDAFATAHRIESSTYGICDFVKTACMGPLLHSEIKILKKILYQPLRPMVTIVGGAKVSTKFQLLHSLLKITDTMLVGGGIANTFLSTRYSIGKSLHEKNFQKQAKKMLETKKISLPIDSRVKITDTVNSNPKIKSVSMIESNEEILDIGDQTIQKYKKIIKKAKTILWNGPLGVFELPNFRTGTAKIASYIANSSSFSIAGGGDTIAVIDLLNLKEKISYISTGGGAFLEFIEKQTLPIINRLNQF